MSVAVYRSILEHQDITMISTSLAKWYDAHASVRRLWAVDEGSLLAVYISLEPTSDGDDALPVWLAMNREWSSDLTSIIPREVRLRLVTSSVLSPSDIRDDAVIVADVNWREAWIDS
jgi:hypothetical protein